MIATDPTFAAEVEQVLVAARYKIIFDARKLLHRTVCQFMAERWSADGKRAIHVSVYCANQRWSYCTWYALGNAAQTRSPGDFTLPSQLREALEDPWAKD